MANNLGDFDTSAVIYGKFATFRPSTGATFTLGGTPALSVYKDNSVTQSTTGVTLTADFDSVTGLNHFAIDTSADGTFYAAGSFFDIVITTGTVDSVSVTGSVVGQFTLRKTSDLRPTTAGRTLDVSAGGGLTVRVTANTDQVNGSATAASNVSSSMQAIARGTCSGGTTTTAVVSSMTSPSTLTATGQLIGRSILFDSTTATAALQGQASNITNSTTGSTPTITFTAMTTAPANTDTFSVV